MTFKFTQEARNKWREDLETTRREYITERYASDGVIAKEIYKVYKDFSKEKIDEQINDVCPDSTVETPVNLVRKQPLFQVKQIVMKKESDTDQTEVVYENMPSQLNLDMRRLEYLSNSPICYWRPYQVNIIEDTLKRIPELCIIAGPHTIYENFRVFRGYFDSKMIDLICLLDIFVCKQTQEVEVEKDGVKKKVPKTSYIRRALTPSELAMLIERIRNALDERNPHYSKHSRIVLISQTMCCSMRGIRNNLLSRPRGKIKFGLMFLGDSRDGLIVEYDERMTKQVPLEKIGIMEIGQPRDLIKRVDFTETGRNNRCMYGLKDFETPIIKRIKFYQPAKNSSWKKPRSVHMDYDKAKMIHIAKYLANDIDVERFEELYPDILFRRIASRTDNPGFVERKKVITQLLGKLDNLNN